MKNELGKIAKEILDIDTLETQYSNAHDFKDIAVWNIQAALEAAYKAGKKSNILKELLDFIEAQPDFEKLHKSLKAHIKNEVAVAKDEEYFCDDFRELLRQAREI